MQNILKPFFGSHYTKQVFAGQWLWRHWQTSVWVPSTSEMCSRMVSYGYKNKTTAKVKTT